MRSIKKSIFLAKSKNYSTKGQGSKDSSNNNINSNSDITLSSTVDDRTRLQALALRLGPNIDIAIKLIKRMKGIFERKLGLVFQNKETVLAPGWGSSPFGIVITQFVDKTIQIIFAEEYERPDFEKMVIKIASMLFKYRITKVYVDGSNPSFISSLKRRVGENPNCKEYTKEKLQNQIHGRMVVCPVNFSQKHRDMLMQLKLFFERHAIAHQFEIR